MCCCRKSLTRLSPISEKGNFTVTAQKGCCCLIFSPTTLSKVFLLLVFTFKSIVLWFFCTHAYSRLSSLDSLRMDSCRNHISFPLLYSVYHWTRTSGVLGQGRMHHYHSPVSFHSGEECAGLLIFGGWHKGTSSGSIFSKPSSGKASQLFLLCSKWCIGIVCVCVWAYVCVLRGWDW